MFGLGIDLILVMGVLIAAYMAWNIGPNDVANAWPKWATSVIELIQSGLEVPSNPGNEGAYTL